MPKKKADPDKKKKEKKTPKSSKTGKSKSSKKKDPSLTSVRAEKKRPSDQEIAVRAYYISERRIRMGWPGNDLDDWLDAERQLLMELARKTS